MASWNPEAAGIGRMCVEPHEEEWLWADHRGRCCDWSGEMVPAKMLVCEWFVLHDEAPCRCDSVG